MDAGRICLLTAPFRSFYRPLIGYMLSFLPKAVLVVMAVSAAAASGPDFNRDVRPVLEKRCAMCHGAAQQMSGLRFDLRENALKGGYSGPAIVPGDASA